MNTLLPPEMQIRNAMSEDHPRIINVMKDWWGGRDLTHMLPRLFLKHFNDTSFVVEKDGHLIAFLVGFLSQSCPQEGYIHFAGVDPSFQGKGVGKTLYQHFFELCKKNKRNMVRSCTSPVNKDSIAFHTKIGFKISQGDSEMEGIPVTLDYNKPDDPKVQFEIEI